MTLAEKILYHQTHPAKLATDIIASLVSLYFFWRHRLIFGLAIHLAPPILASVLLVSFGDFEAQKKSAFGRYLALHMTRIVEISRIGGDVVTIFGAWYRAPVVIAVGLLIVLVAWASGPIRRRVV
jgi:hypothetical protein